MVTQCHSVQKGWGGVGAHPGPVSGLVLICQPTLPFSSRFEPRGSPADPRVPPHPKRWAIWSLVPHGCWGWVGVTSMFASEAGITEHSEMSMMECPVFSLWFFCKSRPSSNQKVVKGRKTTVHHHKSEEVLRHNLGMILQWGLYIGGDTITWLCKKETKMCICMRNKCEAPKTDLHWWNSYLYIHVHTSFYLTLLYWTSQMLYFL